MSEQTVHVLIVDDEPDTCANLADILTTSGEAALELVRSKRYYVALPGLQDAGHGRRRAVPQA
jgi:hypothetical protein